MKPRSDERPRDSGGGKEKLGLMMGEVGSRQQAGQILDTLRLWFRLQIITQQLHEDAMQEKR